jgi:hypothetical protein
VLVGVLVGVIVFVGVILGVMVGVGVLVGVIVFVGVILGVIVFVGVILGVIVGVGVLVGVGVGVTGVGVGVGVTVLEGVIVTPGSLNGLQQVELSTKDSNMFMYRTSLTGKTEVPLSFTTVNCPINLPGLADVFLVY